ncbi:DNA-binding protein, partial [bacterium]|nr:DNA-binding protein [bacterium]
MPRTPIISHETYAPNQEEVSLAKETYEKLVSMVENQHELQIKISKAGSQCEEITLPASALDLLMNFLKEMAKGNTVSVIPVEMEFTTQQAADFLNVSRPYLVRLLDEG